MFCAMLKLWDDKRLRQHFRASLWYASLIGVLSGIPAVAVAQPNTDTESPLTISEVIVNRVNIFSDKQASENPVYNIANRLHRTTIENTIVRELGVAPGDQLTAQRVAEFERQLRQTGLFAAVSVQLEEATPGTAKLQIDTRDQFSIVAGANGSFLGGVGEFGFTIGERNLLGLGDSITLSLSGNTDDEVRGAFTYKDFHFVNRHTRAVYQAGRTEEGEFAVVRFSRPFKAANDRRAWSVFVESRQQDIDFYEDGVSVGQVPELRRVLNAEQFWRGAAFGQVLRRGLVFDYRQLEYQPVRGSQADSYEQPSDSSQVSATVVVGFDSRLTHRKITGLDTLQFVQDIGFGYSSELRLGLRYTENADTGSDTTTPLVSARASNAVAWTDNTFLNVGVRASAAVNENSTDWNAGLVAKAFHRWTNNQTLATRINYRKAVSEGNLPVQFTLGEDNGLRGYASRLLSGDERLQVNLEHRININRKLGILDTGLVGFADFGWVAEEAGESALKRSVGVGLRLGSNALLGRGVIRIDVAVPLDDDTGENKPTVSMALGQVFSF